VDGSSAIFALQGEHLVRLASSSYVSENLLQQYLEQHPDLLPGDQINKQEPRRWLLIGREMFQIDSTDGSVGRLIISL
jgi:hypothetical protein